VQPTDPTLKQVIADIEAALAVEVKSMTWGQPGVAHGGVPGEYGICCNRTMLCDCDGPPSVSLPRGHHAVPLVPAVSV
jgi:hypothetical protein